MNTFIILLMIVVFAYTIGFAFQLWKDKNKVGSVTVFLLALAIVITPIFTVLR